MPESRIALSGGAPRYRFIDLLRGFALVVMIETHVLNAYLPPALKNSRFFIFLAFINGLVAPAFLFATGFSLVLQSNLQWDNWLRFRSPFWRQMRRLGFIALVAYFSHLYGFRLSRYRMNWGNGAMWASTLQVDILQCIVASLLVVLALILILRKRNLLFWGSGLLTLLIAFATPWIWAQDFRGKLPLSLALFLNPQGISLFPLFPWMCFVLAGSCACCIFIKYADTQKILQYMRTMAWMGIVLIAAGYLLRNVPAALPGYVDFFRTSPLYVMIRLGCVLLIFALLFKLESTRWAPRIIELAGRESLLVYGVHLFLIFGVLRGSVLGPTLGRQAGYAICFFVSAAIIVLMLYLAKWWHALKKEYPSHVRRSQAAIVIIMIAVFLLS